LEKFLAGRSSTASRDVCRACERWEIPSAGRRFLEPEGLSPVSGDAILVFLRAIEVMVHDVVGEGAPGEEFLAHVLQETWQGALPDCGRAGDAGHRNGDFCNVFDIRGPRLNLKILADPLIEGLKPDFRAQAATSRRGIEVGRCARGGEGTDGAVGVAVEKFLDESEDPADMFRRKVAAPPRRGIALALQSRNLRRQLGRPDGRGSGLPQHPLPAPRAR